MGLRHEQRGGRRLRGERWSEGSLLLRGLGVRCGGMEAYRIAIKGGDGGSVGEGKSVM